MPRKSRLSKGKDSQSKREEKISKIEKAKEIKRVLESLGPENFEFIFAKKRVDDDLQEEFMKSFPNDYTRIFYGQVAVKDVDTWEIVALIRFSPFSDMQPEEMSEFQSLTSAFVGLSKRGNKITRNASHKEGIGSMYAFGWRRGSDANLTMGKYMLNGSTKKSPTNLEKWREDQEQTIAWIGDIYRKRFSIMALRLFEDVSKAATTIGVPDFCQTEYVDLEQNKNVLASNLTFTLNDFSNAVHKDNDYNSYAYGIWAPLLLKTGELAVMGEGNGFISEGGQFIIPSYKINVDFSNHDGIVEIVWRSNKDFHATLPSKSLDGYSWLGSSVQINRTLVSRIWKLITEYDTFEEFNDRVCGLDQILAEIRGEI